MRLQLMALALRACPALAETDSHLAEANGLRALHVGAPATAKGNDALIYLDVENTFGTQAVLTGCTAMDQRFDLVGFTYGAAGEAWTALPGLPVLAGREVMLEPKMLALRWQAISVDLVAGAEVKIKVTIGTEILHGDIKNGAANATGQSHAGHSH